MAASKNLSPTERKLRGSFAGHESWKQTEDRAARAQRGHETRLRKREDELDPDGVMSPRDRRKAAINARKAEMARLAFKASKARRAKNGSGP